MNNIVFSLNDSNYITIALKERLALVNFCSAALIILCFRGKKYQVVEDSLYYYMDLFHTLLTKAIHNKFRLHESINDDIGYLGNESFQNKLYLVYEGPDDEWVGEKHSLWAGNGFATWLYNDVNGAIILEIAPFYPFHYKNFEDDSFFIPYEEWIKQYAPYLLQEIPKKVAQQWLHQIDSLLVTIRENTEREQVAYEDKCAKK